MSHDTVDGLHSAFAANVQALYDELPAQERMLLEDLFSLADRAWASDAETQDDDGNPPSARRGDSDAQHFSVKTLSAILDETAPSGPIDVRRVVSRDAQWMSAGLSCGRPAAASTVDAFARRITAFHASSAPQEKQFLEQVLALAALAAAGLSEPAHSYFTNGEPSYEVWDVLRPMALGNAGARLR
jgi:hypothetical protein